MLHVNLLDCECIMTKSFDCHCGNCFYFLPLNVLGCGCKKVMDQESIMSQLGVATHKFDEIGEFTYCLVLQGSRDTVSQSQCCSVVVERTAKVT